MPVIEAQRASILVPHDHRHINHVSQTPCSAHSLIGWRTSCRMLTSRAIVAQGLRRLGAGVREPLHHASTAALPLAGFTGSASLLVRQYQGRRGMTSGGCPE